MIHNFNGTDVIVNPCKCGCDEIFVDAGMLACRFVCQKCSRSITHSGFQEGLEFWNEQNPLPEPRPESGREFVPCGRTRDVDSEAPVCVGDNLCDHCEEMVLLHNTISTERARHDELIEGLTRVLRRYFGEDVEF